ncbi:MAG: hypothetical protein EPN23_07020, partial [Verrucomicrobia bacterium]
MESGAVFNASNTITLASWGLSSTGVLNMAGAKLNILQATGLQVGGTTSRSNSVGTLNMLANTTNTMMGGGSILLGNAANVTGVLNLQSGSALNATNSAINLGSTSGGIGFLNMTNASLVITGNVNIGSASGGTGTLMMTNSTLTAGGWTIGNSGGTGTVSFGQGSVVTLPALSTTRTAGSYATLTFDGGTLSNRAASTSYLQGLDHAYLTTNGAIFNVGANIT